MLLWLLYTYTHENNWNNLIIECSLSFNTFPVSKNLSSCSNLPLSFHVLYVLHMCGFDIDLLTLCVAISILINFMRNNLTTTTKNCFRIEQFVDHDLLEIRRIDLQNAFASVYFPGSHSDNCSFYWIFI